MIRMIISIIFWYKDLVCERKEHDFGPYSGDYGTCRRCGVTVYVDGTEDMYYACIYRSSMALRISWVKRPLCKLKRHRWQIRGQVYVCQRCGKRKTYYTRGGKT